MDFLFLHHSTGQCILNGGVTDWFDEFNNTHNTVYRITDSIFPKSFPYGWRNYPFDYWNIWVKHAGSEAYIEPVSGMKNRAKLQIKQHMLRQEMGEPTLEMLTRIYHLIIFKHCFPVSSIIADNGFPDCASEEKRTENYKLQYLALREKLHQFPTTRFLLWTGPALTSVATTPDDAQRVHDFFEWVRHNWDQPGDNIFLFDFRMLETEGGLYLKDEYASEPRNSHPNGDFSRKVAPLFCQRIVNVAEGYGDETSLTGE